MAEALSARCYRTLGGKFRNYRFFLKFENALNLFGNVFIGIFCHYCWLLTFDQLFCNKKFFLTLK